MMLCPTQRLLVGATRGILAAYKDKKGGILFTPGPLSTTRRVKEQMLVDYGSRDTAFIDTVRGMRSALLRVAGVSAADFTAVPMQGSGSMGLEAVVGTLVPPGGRLLILRNGAYGDRLNSICKRLAIDTVFYDGPEDKPICTATAEQLMEENPDINMVAVVHCETSTGVFNDVEEIGSLVRKHCPQAVFFVDAMSSFGGKTLDFTEACVDVLVSSSNKCVQGVPGFSIVICRKSALEDSAGWARSYTLDLAMQDKGLNASGQFNNTPPVQSIMAFAEALKELEEEGGVPARQERYQMNQQLVTEGMQRLGFRTYLDSTKQSFGHIITAFHYPEVPNWDFKRFYDLLNSRGFVIYPGKAARAPCFRIGHIGDIQPEDSKALLVAVEEVLQEMGVKL